MINSMATLSPGGQKWPEVPSPLILFGLTPKNILVFNISVASEKLPMLKSSAQKSWSWLTNIPIGTTSHWLTKWDAMSPRCASGEPRVTMGLNWKRRLDLVRNVFFPSIQRVQMTALACTLPRDEGRPFSRWSIPELIKTAIAKGIVPHLSASTLWRWLKADKIKPWRFHSWQKPTDPRFLERAVPILDLYTQAQSLAVAGHVIVCADEKPSIQARKLQGGMQAAKPGHPVRVGDRYKRQGAFQLFTALLVSTGETLARCFARKCFTDFQSFLTALFGSLWCQNIRCLHLILDNGPTHAPKRLEPWIQSLALPFDVQVHWLPVHASWLDQVEIIFSQLQRKVLTPNHFDDLQNLEHTVMHYFDDRNKNPKPIHWTYTSDKLRAKLQTQVPCVAA